jgi:hypothetical protein
MDINILDFKKKLAFVVFLVILFIAFIITNLYGIRYFGSQSDKWSPEPQGQHHK